VRRTLSQAGVDEALIVPARPSLEDVFVTLTKRNAAAA
jgi:hypothetical protein